MRRIHLSLALSLLTIGAFARSDEAAAGELAEDAIAKGDSLYAKGAVVDARRNYEAAHVLQPENASVDYKIGLCALDGPEAVTSLPWFQQAARLDPDLPKVHYMLACAYQLNARWDEAMAEFKLHIAIISASPDADPTFLRSQKHLLECTYGKEFMANPGNAFVTAAGPNINTSAPEYRPLLVSGGGMIFTSKRIADVDPQQPASEIIRKSSWMADGWSPSVPFAEGNKNSFDANKDMDCTYRSADGQWLYFSSTRKGGSGGSDLYRSAWDKAAAAWGPAENLGAVINSEFDEVGASLSVDGGTLYFASEGHTSMGGFDLFKSTWKQGAWSAPENLGWPINSPGDDRDLVLAADVRSGYFSSDRTGGAGYSDIYRVDLVPGGQLDATAMLASAGTGIPTSTREQRLRLIGFIKGIRMMDPVEAHIEMLDLADPSFSATFTSDPVTGEFTADVPAGRNYAMHVMAPGFLPHTERVSGHGAPGDVRMDVDLATSDPGNKEVMRNILFGSGETDLAPGSTTDLDQLVAFLGVNKALRIEVDGHTDGDICPIPNQVLSDRRAQVVLDYLVAHGISRDRLIAKGYGSSQPLYLNDTPEHKALNRRTEIKVL